jgi:hypothetical protein
MVQKGDERCSGVVLSGRRRRFRREKRGRTGVFWFFYQESTFCVNTMVQSTKRSLPMVPHFEPLGLNKFNLAATVLSLAALSTGRKIGQSTPKSQ